MHVEDLRSLVRDAIKKVQSEVRWRPGSAVGHLLKRKARQQLPWNATLDDYEQVIKAVVSDLHARVFVYWHGHKPYPTVVSVIAEHHWLVMFDADGVLESAFVVERPDRYLDRPAFAMLGTLGEIVR